MSVITSKDSRTFKELQRLTQKKYRDREGLFIAENPKVVGEALSQDGIDALRVIAREGSGYESFTDGTVTLSAELFDRVSDTMTSQGVLAVVKKPDRGDIKALLDGSDIIVLDRLQDPGNIGTIIRTAEGAGISQKDTAEEHFFNDHRPRHKDSCTSAGKRTAGYQIRRRQD